MKSKLATLGFCAVACLSTIPPISTGVGAEPGVQIEVIRWDGFVSDLPIRLRESWNSLGIDPQDNVYCVFGGRTEKASDCALFQYNAKTGQRRLLGTFSQTLAAAGNLAEDEPIPKGHTQLPCVNGKIYIGTMGFHDAINLGSEQMIEAQNTRGAHLLAYDPATDKLQDLSADQPQGVFFQGQGFIALSAIPETGLLAALTVPNGDLLLYDPAQKAPRAVVRGVPGELGNYVGREVIAVSPNRIYVSYHSARDERARARGGKPPGRMYVCDPLAGRRSETPFACDASVWNGQTKTRDGRGIYLVSQTGFLYRLTPDNDRLAPLGSVYPDSDRHVVRDEQYEYGVPRVFGIVLSSDEQHIYCIPVRQRGPLKPTSEDRRARLGGMVAYGFCQFDLATRSARRLAELPPDTSTGWITGSDTRDSQGNVYFVVHDFRGYCGLLKCAVDKNGQAVDAREVRGGADEK